MAKYTKKWEKDFLKRYTTAVDTLNSIEAELTQMKLDNPDTWELTFLFPDRNELNLGKYDSHFISNTHEDIEQGIDEVVEIQLKTQITYVNVSIFDLDELKSLRDALIDAVDDFKRPIVTKINNDIDDSYGNGEDESNGQLMEYTFKAERSLTEAWTGTVRAHSREEAYEKMNNDEDVQSNYDSEYYDYGEIDYEITDEEVVEEEPEVELPPAKKAVPKKAAKKKK